jgi:DNA-binding transcriptional LysR family regulator
MKNLDILSLNCVLEVYEHRSLTKAGRKLGLSKVSVSKRITQIESKFGESFFNRKTRSVTPTLYCEKIIDEIKEITSRIDQLQSKISENKPEGLVRLTLNATLAHTLIDSSLKKFQKKYPLVQIELVVTDNILSLSESNIDMALRIDPEKNSLLTGRKVGDFKLNFVISPRLLKKTNKQITFENLSTIPFFAIDHHMNRIKKSNKKLVQDLDKKRHFKTNDSLLITKKIIDGDGFGIRSNWEAEYYKENGKLKSILENELNEIYGHIWLLSHPERLKLKRVRLLYDFLIEELKSKL